MQDSLGGCLAASSAAAFHQVPFPSMFYECGFGCVCVAMSVVFCEYGNGCVCVCGCVWHVLRVWLWLCVYFVAVFVGQFLLPCRNVRSLALSQCSVFPPVCVDDEQRVAKQMAKKH